LLTCEDQLATSPDRDTSKTVLDGGTDDEFARETVLIESVKAIELATFEAAGEICSSLAGEFQTP
jgi:hypothetical protein